MLPNRIRKPAKRASRWRSQAHCSFVRSHECCVPGCRERPIEVAHVRRGSGAGVGQKPDDWNTISLCGGIGGHHSEQHRLGEASFENRHGIDMRELADKFAQASPRSYEIMLAKIAREQDLG
jgi:hypothetical protein